LALEKSYFVIQLGPFSGLSSRSDSRLLHCYGCGSGGRSQLLANPFLPDMHALILFRLGSVCMRLLPLDVPSLCPFDGRATKRYGDFYARLFREPKLTAVRTRTIALREPPVYFTLLGAEFPRGFHRVIYGRWSSVGLIPGANPEIPPDEDIAVAM
jgi:hypothetical protein